jgi:hypothetical protein
MLVASGNRGLHNPYRRYGVGTGAALKDWWAIWTDGGIGLVKALNDRPASWVYRLADGWYLAGGLQGASELREERMASRPRSPYGFESPPGWHQIVVWLLDEPATETLAAEVRSREGRPDRDWVWWLVAAARQVSQRDCKRRVGGRVPLAGGQPGPKP